MHSDSRVGAKVRPCALDCPPPGDWDGLLSYQNIFLFFIIAANYLLSIKANFILIRPNRGAVVPKGIASDRMEKGFHEQRLRRSTAKDQFTAPMKSHNPSPQGEKDNDRRTSAVASQREEFVARRHRGARRPAAMLCISRRERPYGTFP
jgi:hypothetical protein